MLERRSQRGNRTVKTDEETRAILYDGANLSQLGVLFKMDHRTLVEKLHPLQPTGERNGVPTYAVLEAARYLVKPEYEIEAYIKRMHHNDLPKHLSKEFWAGQRSKQDYLIKAGQLWDTSQVIETMGEVFQNFRMAVQLIRDSVERQVELTPRQRDLITEQLDGVLIEAQRALVAKYQNETTDVKEADSEL